MIHPKYNSDFSATLGSGRVGVCLALLNYNDTFILASSKMGNIMKTGSTGVAEYRRPSVWENKELCLVSIALLEMQTSRNQIKQSSDISR